jgi:hypothetical protein
MKLGGANKVDGGHRCVAEHEPVAGGSHSRPEARHHAVEFAAGGGFGGECLVPADDSSDAACSRWQTSHMATCILISVGSSKTLCCTAFRIWLPLRAEYPCTDRFWGWKRFTLLIAIFRSRSSESYLGQGILALPPLAKTVSRRVAPVGSMALFL